MSNLIDYPRRASGTRPALQGIAGSATRCGLAPLAPLRAAADTPPTTLGVGTLRAVIAASDALRAHLDGCHPDPALADLQRPHGLLADLLHRYQVASRQCVREWLQDPSATTWVAESSSGRLVNALRTPGTDGDSIPSHLQGLLADSQPLHGLRQRHTRAGIGIPLVLATRERSRARRAGATEALARTAVVFVERGFDSRLRTVRVHLVDPLEVGSIRLRGTDLPLAADWTAAVAHLLGVGRRPPSGAAPDAANPVRLRAGFVPLSPAAPGRTPLVLIEGAGLSPLMMAQVANEVAGDPELRGRYVTWLYRYPMTAPLVQSAARLRTDLERFCRALDATGDGTPTRAVLVAQGPSAMLARTLLVDSGDGPWDAVFTGPADTLPIAPADRAWLDSMLRWTHSDRVLSVVAVNLPDNPGALVAGVGERAVQAALHLPSRARARFERLHALASARLRPDARYTPHGTAHHAALHAATIAAEHALLGLLGPSTGPAGAVLYDAASGPGAAAELDVLDGAPLGPQAQRQLLAWLRGAARGRRRG